MYKAPQGTEVFGPVEGDEVSGSTWMIDGRGRFACNMLALADTGAGSLDDTDQEDRGVPGDQYHICLAIAGKWRTVTWSKIKTSDDLPAPSLGKYYVSGNW